MNKSQMNKLARFEYHDWGYFLRTRDKAIAITGHGEWRLRAGVKELRPSLTTVGKKVT